MKCEQCYLWLPDEQHLIIHKKISNFTQQNITLIKKSLNFTKGGTGGLSNPNKRQAYSNCEPSIDNKRDKKSDGTGSNYQLNNKKSAQLEIFLKKKIPEPH